VSRHQTKQASMHALRFGTQSKQSSKQNFQASISKYCMIWYCIRLN